MGGQLRQQLRPNAVGAVGGHYGKIIQLAHPAALGTHHQQIGGKGVPVKHAPCVGGALRFAGQDHAQGLQLSGRKIPAHLVQVNVRQLLGGQQPPGQALGVHTIRVPFW